MALEAGKKCLCIPDGKGGYTAYEISAPTVGEKCILLPDGKGGYIAVGTGAPSAGDKVPVVPDGKGGYLTWKAGMGYTFKALGTSGTTIYYTIDNGQTWKTNSVSLPVTTDPGTGPNEPLPLTQLGYLGSNRIMITGEYYGAQCILRSDNFGVNWAPKKFSGTALSGDPTMRFCHLGSGRVVCTYYVATGHYFKIAVSTDYGNNWTDKGSFSTRSDFPHFATEIGYDNDTNLIITTSNNINGKAGSGDTVTYYSHDNGETWAQKDIASSYTKSYMKSVTSCGGNDTWIISRMSGASHPYYTGEILQSTDNGETWSLISNSMAVAGKVVSPEVGTVLLFGSTYYFGKYYRSTDYGSNWTYMDYSTHWNSDAQYSQTYNCVAAIKSAYGGLLSTAANYDDIIYYGGDVNCAFAFVTDTPTAAYTAYYT